MFTKFRFDGCSIAIAEMPGATGSLSMVLVLNSSSWNGGICADVTDIVQGLKFSLFGATVWISVWEGKIEREQQEGDISFASLSAARFFRR